jgi:hypothetical protein
MIMTQDKALKAAIRARMAETGEPYSVARRALRSEGNDEQERGGIGRQPGSPAPQAPAEDYYARYAREAELAGVPADEVRAMLADDLAQHRADAAQQAADLAQQRADHAEEAAERAEEHADLAEEAAVVAHEWAGTDKHAQAEQRAEIMRDRARRARQAADLAQEAADLAQQRADLAWAAVDDAGDEDDGWRWPYHAHPLRPARPPRAPRPPRPPRVAPLTGFLTSRWAGPGWPDQE